MADGRLLVFTDKEYKGDVYYVNVYPGVSIGGFMPSRKTIPISFHHPLKKKLEQALLEIGVIVPDTNVKWRVKVNGISITKEFKPHSTCKAGSKLFAKLVYDITSIMKTPESIRKRRVNVTFKTEGGGESLLVEHLGILAFYPTREAVSNIYYLSGALSLEPGEKAELSFKYRSEKALVDASIYMPSPDAVGRLLINDYEVPISGIRGMDEVSAMVEGLGDNNKLTIIHEDTGETYYPKQMRVSSIILIDKVYKEPKIVVEEVKAPEELRIGEKIKVKITNKGESRPDSLLVVLMNLGNVVHREILKPIEPGETIELELPVKLPSGEYEVIVRVIWSKLSRNWFDDRRVKIIIV